MNSTESTMQLEDFIMLLIAATPEWNAANKLAAELGAPISAQITVTDAPRSTGSQQ